MAKKPKKKNKLLISGTIILVSTILLLTLLLTSNKNNLTEQNYISKCDSGFLPKDKFLSSYEVESGDSLLSIANNELGNTNRINELINLNRDQHPNISLSNNFLEIGYKLYIPPKKIANSSGDLFAIKGEIGSIKSDQWGIERRSGFFFVYINENTQFPNNKNLYEVGDCVKVIGDFEETNAALIVESQ